MQRMCTARLEAQACRRVQCLRLGDCMSAMHVQGDAKA